MSTSKHYACRALLTLALLISANVTWAQEARGVARLAWLAGCWSSESPQGGGNEQWMVPLAGTMLGMARTVKAGKTVGFEFMRIHEAADGTLLYTALPSGQSETTFTERSLSEAEVVFENLQHDFPQRVSYRYQGEGQLLASIEGSIKGKIKRIKFPMRRIQCLKGD